MGKWVDVKNRVNVKIAANSETADEFVSAVRRFPGKHKNQSEAPWAGKTFAAQYARRDRGTEYQGGLLRINDQVGNADYIL